MFCMSLRTVNVSATFSQPSASLARHISAPIGVWRFCLVLRYADYSSCSCSRFSIYLSVIHVCVCMPYSSFFHFSGHNLVLSPGENGTFQSLCGFLMVSDVSTGIFGPFSALYVWVHVSDASAWLLSLTCVCDSVL